MTRSEPMRTRAYLFIRSSAARVFRYSEKWALRIRRIGPVRYSWEFAVCAIFKNEARHLDEWLTFHRLSGVDHFFLYDDESTDGFLAVLQPWIERGMVTLRPAEGRRQVAVYNHCLRHGARRARWVAFIDIDEFLFNPGGESLPSTMERYSSYPGVFVHWVLFGSNGHVTPPGGGTIDSYTTAMSIESAIRDDFDHSPDGQQDRASSRSRSGKSIIDPRAVLIAGLHAPIELVRGYMVDEQRRPHTGEPNSPGEPFTCDVLRINHYWSRSIEELRAKIAKGTPIALGHKYQLDPSLEREQQLNEVEDHVIQRARERLLANDDDRAAVTT